MHAPRGAGRAPEWGALADPTSQSESLSQSGSLILANARHARTRSVIYAFTWRIFCHAARYYRPVRKLHHRAGALRGVPLPPPSTREVPHSQNGSRNRISNRSKTVRAQRMTFPCRRILGLIPIFGRIPVWAELVWFGAAARSLVQPVMPPASPGSGTTANATQFHSAYKFHSPWLTWTHACTHTTIRLTIYCRPEGDVIATSSDNATTALLPRALWGCITLTSTTALLPEKLNMHRLKFLQYGVSRTVRSGQPNSCDCDSNQERYA